MNKGQDNFNKQSGFPNINRSQLITIGDLQDFKLQLFYEIKQLAKELMGKPNKQWLKSHEVRKLLGISPGTLQNLRNNGKIPFTKVGGIVYYDTNQIKDMMEKQKLAII